MKLQTKIPIISNEPKIDYDSKIVLLGSCFVENIGDKLNYVKFQTLQNPFGILFHPIAIENIIERALQNNSFTEEDVFFKNDRWYCFEMHSSINATNKKYFLDLINIKLAELKAYLLNSTHVVLTFGTAWVYRFIKTKKLVANCFKIPQKEFKKKLLSVSDISSSLSNIISLIKENNPKASIITTVSPVRHLKDGFVENNLSKAHLITAIHQVLSKDSNSKTHFYFPSYEMMMDELREYRFYKEDMIHPNNIAVTIIWEAFNQAWISSKTEPFQKVILAIQTGLKHKPFNPDSEEHLLFVKDLKSKINLIKKEIPHLKF
tara:strand:- start:12261 stop:13217 length:957 start_codon:yes stop_codon:yes gene_type:complete